MPDAKLVEVGRFNSQIEAEIAKGALETAEIDSMIQSDTAGGMRPHLAWSGGGFRLLVREEDLADARALLDSQVEETE